jgi:hypothetical protein
MVSEYLMTVLVISSDGLSIQPIRPSGAPALYAASATTFAAAMVESFARGCGEMMMPFLVFSVISVLKIAV